VTLISLIRIVGSDKIAVSFKAISFTVLTPVRFRSLKTQRAQRKGQFMVCFASSRLCVENSRSKKYERRVAMKKYIKPRVVGSSNVHPC
jgi:hypothetical protein